MPVVESSLEPFVARIITEAKNNRGQTAYGQGANNGEYAFSGTEGKWASNIASVIPENVRPSIGGRDSIWRASDAKEGWQSRAKCGATANAISAAHDFFDDVLFRQGFVPYRINLVQSDGQNTNMKPEEAALIEVKIEKHMDSLHSKCNAIQNILAGVLCSALYGPRVFHTFYVKDENSPSKLRASFEWVNVWECFWDMDNMGDVADGEYFNRRQAKAAWRVMNMASSLNEDAQKNLGGFVFNMDKLEAAIRKGRNGESGSIGTNNTQSQSGTPETDDLTYRTRTEQVDELWCWISKSFVEDYIRENQGSVPIRDPDQIDVIDAEGNILGSVGPNGIIPSQSSSPTSPDTNGTAAEIPQAGGTVTHGSDLGMYGRNVEKRVWCQVYLVNDKVVGVLPEPGPLPYRKSAWHRIPGCRDDLGIADRTNTDQKALDGIIKAIENDAKMAKSIVAHDASLNISGKRLEEELGKPIAIITVDQKSVNGSLSNVFSSTTIPSNMPQFLKAYDTFINQLDYSSGFSRVMQQGPVPDDSKERSAFAVHQHMESSGRHCGSKIRALDEDIVWLNKRLLQMEVDVGNIELPMDVEIKGGGYRTYARQLGLTETMLNIWDRLSNDPETSMMMNKAWIVSELVDANGIDPEKFLCSQEQLAAKKQAQIDSPQMQMQMQQLEETLKALTAKAGKDDAMAQKLMADAQAIMATIGQNQSRLELDRARGATEIAAKHMDIKNPKPSGSRNERRMSSMEPSAIVRRPQPRQKLPS